MATPLDSLYVELGLDADSYTKGWRSASATTARESRNITRHTDAMSRGTAKHMGVMERASHRVTRVWSNMAVRMGALAVVGGIAAIGTGAIKAAASFEYEMSRIQAVSGATAAKLVPLRKAIIQLGKDTVFSAGESAQAAMELIKAGLTIGETSAALPGTLALAAAGEIEVAQAAETAANAMNMFGLGGKDVMAVADALAGAANASSLEVSDLSMAMGFIGPVARNLHIPFEELIAMMAELGNQGIKGEKAGTGLRGMLDSLVGPSSIAKKAIAELGLKVYDAQGKFKAMPQLLGELQEKFAKLDEPTRNDLLSKIFGRESASVALSLINKGSAGLEAMTTEVSKAGEANRVAAKKMDNLKGSWEQLTGSLETLAIGAGTPLMGGLRDLTDAFTESLNKALDFQDRLEAISGWKGADLRGKIKLGLDQLTDDFSRWWATIGSEEAPNIAEKISETLIVGAGQIGAAVGGFVGQFFLEAVGVDTGNVWAEAGAKIAWGFIEGIAKSPFTLLMKAMGWVSGKDIHIGGLGKDAGVKPQKEEARVITFAAKFRISERSAVEFLAKSGELSSAAAQEMRDKMANGIELGEPDISQAAENTGSAAAYQFKGAWTTPIADLRKDVVAKLTYVRPDGAPAAKVFQNKYLPVISNTAAGAKTRLEGVRPSGAAAGASFAGGYKSGVEHALRGWTPSLGNYSGLGLYNYGKSTGGDIDLSGLASLYDVPSGGTSGGMVAATSGVWHAVRSMFPGATFMGGYSYRNIAGTNKLSDHATGHAFDVGGSKSVMQNIATMLALSFGRLPLKYIIYNHQIDNGGGWRPYRGQNPHTDHVHVSTYDTGGWLQPGMSLTKNLTGRPEAILTAAQLAALGGLTDAVTKLVLEIRRQVHADKKIKNKGAEANQRILDAMAAMMTRMGSYSSREQSRMSVLVASGAGEIDRWNQQTRILALLDKEVAGAEAQLIAAKARRLPAEEINKLASQLFDLQASAADAAEELWQLGRVPWTKSIDRWTTEVDQLTSVLNVLADTSGALQGQTDLLPWMESLSRSSFSLDSYLMRHGRTQEEIQGAASAAIGDLSQLYRQEQGALQNALDDTMQKIDASEAAYLRSIDAIDQARDRSRARNAAQKDLGKTQDELRILQGQGFYEEGDIQRMHELEAQAQDQRDAMARQEEDWAAEDRRTAAAAAFEAQRVAAQASFDSLLDQRAAYYATEMQAVIDQEQALLSRMPNWQAAGMELGNSFGLGILASLPQIEAAATAAAQTAANYLELHSPAKRGPLADLDEWFEDFAPTILRPLNMADIAQPIMDSFGPSKVQVQQEIRHEDHIYLHDGGGTDQETLDQLAEKISARMKREVYVASNEYGG